MAERERGERERRERHHLGEIELWWRAECMVAVALPPTNLSCIRMLMY